LISNIFNYTLEIRGGRHGQIDWRPPQWLPNFWRNGPHRRKQRRPPKLLDHDFNALFSSTRPLKLWPYAYSECSRRFRHSPLSKENHPGLQEDMDALAKQGDVRQKDSPSGRAAERRPGRVKGTRMRQGDSLSQRLSRRSGIRRRRIRGGSGQKMQALERSWPLRADQTALRLGDHPKRAAAAPSSRAKQGACTISVSGAISKTAAADQDAPSPDFHQNDQPLWKP